MTRGASATEEPGRTRERSERQSGGTLTDRESGERRPDLTYSVAGQDSQADRRSRGLEGLLTLTEEDDGRSFKISVGDRLRIALHDNSRLDYLWHVKTTDEKVMAFKQASLTEGGQVGRQAGPATRSWVFRAEASGTADVTLRAVRTWKGRPIVAREFSVHLTVREPSRLSREEP